MIKANIVVTWYCEWIDRSSPVKCVKELLVRRDISSARSAAFIIFDNLTL